MPIGIVVLAFAKRVREPNPVNMRLAEIANALDKWIAVNEGVRTIVVAQHEVVLALRNPPALVVTQTDATNVSRKGKPYLDTQDVLNKAFREFRANGVAKVAVVANDFLHRRAAESIVRQAGFEVMQYNAPKVGFDDSPLNLQWYCRGPIRFMAYLGIQVLGKVLKQNFHGIGEKSPPN